MAETKKVAKKASKKEEKVEEVKETKVAKKAKASKKESAPVKETKVAKKSKKEEKVAQKPVVSEVKASALNVKVTPRKARLVIDVVRGKDVDEALAILKTLHYKAAPIVYKVIKSAASNATNNFNMNGDKLYVASIMASDSVKMKRYLPRAKGSASGLIKRFSNIYVTVKERN